MLEIDRLPACELVNSDEGSTGVAFDLDDVDAVAHPVMDRWWIMGVAPLRGGRAVALRVEPPDGAVVSPRSGIHP